MPRGPKGERRPRDVIGNAVHVMRLAALIDDAEMKATIQKRVAALALPQSN